MKIAPTPRTCRSSDPSLLPAPSTSSATADPGISHYLVGATARQARLQHGRHGYDQATYAGMSSDPGPHLANSFPPSTDLRGCPESAPTESVTSFLKYAGESQWPSCRCHAAAPLQV